MSHHSFWNTLSNTRNFRAWVRENNITLEQLEKIQQVAAKIAEEVKEKEERIAQENAERENKLNEFRIRMENEGISMDDLLTAMASSPRKEKKKRAPRPAKYRFQTPEGETKEWTGQGRTPNALQALLDQGHSIEEYLIPVEQQNEQ